MLTLRAQPAIPLTLLILALVAGVRRAEAQVRGIPVYNNGIPSGIGIYGDVGFPDEEAGKGTAYAVSGRAGFGAFGATAILSTFDPDGSGENDVSVGATLNYKVFGAPLTPLSVTLQAGIGYSKPDVGLLPGDEDELRFPIGLGFALMIPNPALAIQPWIAPRVDVVRLSGGGISDTETNLGLGGGVELNLLNGFGVHAAYDRVFIDGGDPSTFGLGAHYAFRIPGL
ncbi:MAG TPA: outer membrane beta-barrel protein [Gemmatimonadales bacterium]|nr:outer membrane beta-barrel protein [Gemmatimonadales bacterium]